MGREESGQQKRSPLKRVGGGYDDKGFLQSKKKSAVDKTKRIRPQVKPSVPIFRKPRRAIPQSQEAFSNVVEAGLSPDERVVVDRLKHAPQYSFQPLPHVKIGPGRFETTVQDYFGVPAIPRQLQMFKAPDLRIYDPLPLPEVPRHPKRIDQSPNYKPATSLQNVRRLQQQREPNLEFYFKPPEPDPLPPRQRRQVQSPSYQKPLLLQNKRQFGITSIGELQSSYRPPLPSPLSRAILEQRAAKASPEYKIFRDPEPSKYSKYPQQFVSRRASPRPPIPEYKDEGSSPLIAPRKIEFTRQPAPYVQMPPPPRMMSLQEVMLEQYLPERKQFADSSTSPVPEQPKHRTGFQLATAPQTHISPQQKKLSINNRVNEAHRPALKQSQQAATSPLHPKRAIFPIQSSQIHPKNYAYSQPSFERIQSQPKKLSFQPYQVSPQKPAPQKKYSESSVNTDRLRPHRKLSQDEQDRYVPSISKIRHIVHDVEVPVDRIVEVQVPVIKQVIKQVQKPVPYIVRQPEFIQVVVPRVQKKYIQVPTIVEVQKQVPRWYPVPVEKIKYVDRPVQKIIHQKQITQITHQRPIFVPIMHKRPRWTQPTQYTHIQKYPDKKKSIFYRPMTPIHQKGVNTQQQPSYNEIAHQYSIQSAPRQRHYQQLPDISISKTAKRVAAINTKHQRDNRTVSPLQAITIPAAPRGISQLPFYNIDPPQQSMYTVVNHQPEEEFFSINESIVQPQDPGGPSDHGGSGDGGSEPSESGNEQAEPSKGSQVTDSDAQTQYEDDEQFHQVGQTSIVIRKSTNKSKTFIGTRVSNQQKVYYTHQSVYLPFTNLQVLVDSFHTLRFPIDADNKEMCRVGHSSVFLICDQYKSINFIGLRHCVWYAGIPQPTRYGFNLRAEQFSVGISRLQDRLQSHQ